MWGGARRGGKGRGAGNGISVEERGRVKGGRMVGKEVIDDLRRASMFELCIDSISLMLKHKYTLIQLIYI